MIKHSDKNLRLSSTDSVVACATRWDSSSSRVPHSSVSKNLDLNINSRTQVSHQMNQGSSSTQSTGQWYPPFTGITAGGTQEQFISMPSGCNGADRWSIDGRARSALSLGNSEKLYSASNADYGQSVVQMCYPYSDPLYGGITPAYLQQAMHLLQIHPQMVGVESNGRVPLPLELTEDGPIYVNAKQYRGILRRRQLRAKLEAQNKLVKGRKPYLHESRHLHAMKRVRGSGGRFLNTKQLQQAQEQNQQQQYKSSDIDCKIFSATSTGSWSSELTSNSNNSDIFQLNCPLGFAEFRAQVGGMHGVTSAKGSRHRYLPSGKL